ncbi:hypothetical protein GCM10008931_38340 [Oceanobacillus oncorhynchi subsp. oncorhynchi]
MKTGNEAGDEPCLAEKPIMTTSPYKGEKNNIYRILDCLILIHKAEW